MCILACAGLTCMCILACACVPLVPTRLHMCTHAWVSSAIIPLCCSAHFHRCSSAHRRAAAPAARTQREPDPPGPRVVDSPIQVHNSSEMAAVVKASSCHVLPRSVSSPRAMLLHLPATMAMRAVLRLPIQAGQGGATLATCCQHSLLPNSLHQGRRSSASVVQLGARNLVRAAAMMMVHLFPRWTSVMLAHPL